MVTPWSLGSTWVRVDPHIHAPGTLRANDYGDHADKKTWERYAERLRDASPPVAVLGITDYFVPRGYRLFRENVSSSEVPSIALIFPNIELRLNIKTDRGQAVNVHLLVSPDTTDHLAVIQSKLHALRFRYDGEHFPCSEDGLRRLGRAHARNPALDDEAALREGASQFLVDFGDFARLKEDTWIAKNVLFAVAAGNDGLSGLSKDSGFHAQREELASLSDVVLSAQPSDRRFWLGDHKDFAARGYSRKPCLHGSDAHALDEVLLPKEERRCWIRSQPTFDGLRQALVEPERRVWIGPAPPRGASPNDVIRYVRILNAPWARTAVLELNDGLVTVIGSRGSGKTALAELIAAAADAGDAEPGNASFIAKAYDHLANAEVEIEWADGTSQRRQLRKEYLNADEPRVRYLSQQFVERLSSPTGLADELVEEIERIVFDAIPTEDRLLCSGFAELREVLLRDVHAEREADQEIIRARTSAIADEHKTRGTLPTLKAKVQEAVRDRTATEKELGGMPITGSSALVKAQRGAAQRLATLQEAIAAEALRAKRLGELASAFSREIRAAADGHAALKATYGNLLQAADWERLVLRPEENAGTTIERGRKESLARVALLREHGPTMKPAAANAPSEGIIALTTESDRATKALGEDLAQAKRRADTERRLGVLKQAEVQATNRLTSAQGGPARQRVAQTDRYDAYERVIGSVVAEVHSLETLYQPLRSRLEADTRLSRLSFFVRRQVALDAWCERGERLLDLRKPPFQGAGALADAARDILLPVWQKGTPTEARSGMETFVERYSHALSALRREATPLEFGEWLFSTDHISVQYGIRYENVDLSNLSPGSRGVVLLTLYLALDEQDSRPLVIDQPEENLDPKSVYSYLVPFFREAARRRQIIMVTHNANLVVNTDTDQVIVAEAERLSPTELPRIQYGAGGLEDANIRGLVCQFLEGGAEAFRRRGQRYVGMAEGTSGTADDQ